MKKTARKKLCCPHCEEMDAAIMSWVHFYNNLKRKRPPDKEADSAPPGQTEDAPKPQTITQEQLKVTAGPHTRQVPCSVGDMYTLAEAVFARRFERANRSPERFRESLQAFFLPLGTDRSDPALLPERAYATGALDMLAVLRVEGDDSPPEKEAQIALLLLLKPPGDGGRGQDQIPDPPAKPAKLELQ